MRPMTMREIQEKRIKCPMAAGPCVGVMCASWIQLEEWSALEGGKRAEDVLGICGNSVVNAEGLREWKDEKGRKKKKK